MRATLTSRPVFGSDETCRRTPPENSRAVLRRLPIVIAASLAAMLHAGCQPDPATQSPPTRSSAGTPAEGRGSAKLPAVEPKNVIKIKVTANGTITADGQPVTLEKLAARFADQKRAGGVVWYYRENPGGEPHANAMQVIKLVVDNQLPVRLSTKPDFSDAVDGNGVSHPDKP